MRLPRHHTVRTGVYPPQPDAQCIKHMVWHAHPVTSWHTILWLSPPTQPAWLIIQAVCGEGFCNMSKQKWKKKKPGTHQMLLHTTFPWIRAVTWQPCCLSVVMDTCVLAAERRIKDREGFCSVSVFYDFWCVQLVNAWTASSHSRGFTYHSHYEDICFCHRSLAIKQEVQSETGSASEKGRSDRSCV